MQSDPSGDDSSEQLSGGSSKRGSSGVGSSLFAWNEHKSTDEQQLSSTEIH